MQSIDSPAWLDLVTDTDRVLPFYAAVLGWTYRELGAGFSGWHFAEAGGVPVAAIGAGPARPWQVFLRVDDIHARVRRAVDVGGTLCLPPGRIADLGSAAQLVDPGNAPLGLWQPDQLPGFSDDSHPGMPVWFEVYHHDAPTVRDFFVQWLGLTAQKRGDMDYWTLKSEGRDRFGVMQLPDEHDPRNAQWMTYFAVASADESAKTIESEGGTVMRGPFDTPFGRMSFAADPAGTAFATVEVRMA